MNTPPIFSFDEHVPMLAANHGLEQLADHVTDELPALVDRIKRIDEPSNERVAA